MANVLPASASTRSSSTCVHNRVTEVLLLCRFVPTETEKAGRSRKLPAPPRPRAAPPRARGTAPSGLQEQRSSVSESSPPGSEGRRDSPSELLQILEHLVISIELDRFRKEKRKGSLLRSLSRLKSTWMDLGDRHCAKWHKSDRERQIAHDLAHMGPLKNEINEQANQSQTQGHSTRWRLPDGRGYGAGGGRWGDSEEQMVVTTYQRGRPRAVREKSSPKGLWFSYYGAGCFPGSPRKAQHRESSQ